MFQSRQEQAHTHVHKYTEKTCPKTVWGACPKPGHVWCPCPNASDFGLGNIKQTQKQNTAIRVLGWMTEAASKYWDCSSPVAMVTETGRILTERERHKTGKTMSPRRMSECVYEQPLRRVEQGEPREEIWWEGTYQYSFVLREQRAGSPLPRSPKAQVRSAQPQNKQRWDMGSLVLLGGRRNQGSLFQVPRDEIRSVCNPV